MHRPRGHWLEALTMPIYGFECAECGHRYDRLQKLADPDPTVCPACGAEALKRQLTAPSFRLSGSGWYETDFKKDGDKKRNLADAGESAKTDSPADSKSDAAATPRTDAKQVDAKPAGEAKPTAASPAPAASSSPPAAS